MPVDHCAKVEELNAVLETIVSGKSIAEARFDEDMTRFSAANIDELKRLIAYHQRECDKIEGRSKRTRFAKRMRY